MKYTSNDFDKTRPEIQVEIPEKLLHRNVLAHGNKADFSVERGHPVGIVDLPTTTISMTIGELKAGQSTNRHRHSYETVIYVTEGKGFSEIGDQVVEWEQGDAIYVPVWSWHRHVNSSLDNRVQYVACENTPLLQNLGGLAIRQEAPPLTEEH